MKKIPTLFERVFEDNRVKEVLNKVTPGMEWVLAGEGTATVKYDGACCAMIDGVFHRRYDCKKGKKPPAGFIPCCEPDSVTGHWPGWIKCERDNPADKWFWAAYDYLRTGLCEGEIANKSEPFINYLNFDLRDGTYEAVGKHFQGNPYKLDCDMLISHGEDIITVDRTFEGIKQYLSEHYIEGIVFWKDNSPQCKIKRSDFGYEWNNR